jgi:hypothetical protein
LEERGLVGAMRNVLKMTLKSLPRNPNDKTMDKTVITVENNQNLLEHQFSINQSSFIITDKSTSSRELVQVVAILDHKTTEPLLMERVQKAMFELRDWRHVKAPIKTNGSINTAVAYIDNQLTDYDKEEISERQRKLKSLKVGLKNSMFGKGWRFNPKEKGVGRYSFIPGKEEIWLKEKDSDSLSELLSDLVLLVSPHVWQMLNDLMTKNDIPGVQDKDYGADYNPNRIGSNVTYTVTPPFFNGAHKDNDEQLYSVGIWATVKESDWTLAPGLHGNGGQFVNFSYDLNVDFSRIDGVVVIIWRGKLDYHCTAQAEMPEGLIRVGTSMQVGRSFFKKMVELNNEEGGEKFVKDDQKMIALLNNKKIRSSYVIVYHRQDGAKDEVL